MTKNQFLQSRCDQCKKKEHCKATHNEYFLCKELLYVELGWEAAVDNTPIIQDIHSGDVLLIDRKWFASHERSICKETVVILMDLIRKMKVLTSDPNAVIFERVRHAIKKQYE